ncbi:MAG: protein kinase [Blastocatellia bacterium]|nr:protein kinase [Blastocatellia bacterium]
MPIAPHTRLSHYEIIAPLGAGELGEVYLAEDLRLDRKVAFKLLPAAFTRDAERVRRFTHEAKAASALNHPNIITVYELGESEAGRFIVMELVAGRSLRAVIATDNSPEALLNLGLQMASGLRAAHAAGLAHRGLTPEKIMVRDDGYVKMLDFGLARLEQDDSGEDETTLGQQGPPVKLMEKVRYMSPEQARGRSVSRASDIFSLGLLFYELATGQGPFKAISVGEMLQAIAGEAPPPPSQLNPRISAALDRLISRMLQKDPAQRPSAAEVEASLLELSGRGAAGALAPEPTRPEAPEEPEEEEDDGLGLAHVLFCDIVGYSLLPIDRQTEMMRTLQEIVRGTDAYRRAEATRQLVRLPAGDGMALAFLQDPSAPVRCAFEIARALKAHPEIRLRMGAHSGPVFRSTDINVNRNVVGEGINMAQRVMDCGDAGHILVSRQVAEILRLVSRWQPYLHDLGVHEVKHEVPIHLYNLYDSELGNARTPTKLRGEKTGTPARPELDNRFGHIPKAGLSLAAAPESPRLSSLQSAPPQPAREPVKTPEPPPPSDLQRRPRALVPALLSLLVLFAGGLFAWNVWETKPAPAAAEREISYSLLVQRMRDGQPFREPFEATGRELFEDGWKFRFQFSSPQSGFVYLLNEGPVAQGAISYQYLFPSPGVNNGAAQLAANQPIQTGWYVIGEAHGTERLLLVWSKEPVQEFEAVKGVVNPIDRGGIHDPVQLSALRQFLNRHTQSKPQVDVGAARKQITLRGRGDVFIHAIELDHP